MAAVYTKADIAIRRAMDEKFGYTHEDIAKICNVSSGSVRRWLMTKRAKASAIQPLLDIVGGSPTLSVDQVAEHLEDLHKTSKLNQNNKKVHRYSISRMQLAKISGMGVLDDDFIKEIKKLLNRHNFFFMEGIDSFAIGNMRWLFRSCPPIEDEALNQFNVEMANQIEDRQDEEEQDDWGEQT